jgi:hypothetical protein
MTVRGEVRSVTSSATPLVRTDAVISDGTGVLLLRYVGRRSIPGLEVGRHLIVDGTPGLIHGDLVMLNPLYSFDESL